MNIKVCDAVVMSFIISGMTDAPTFGSCSNSYFIRNKKMKHEYLSEFPLIKTVSGLCLGRLTVSRVLAESSIHTSSISSIGTLRFSIG